MVALTAQAPGKPLPDTLEWQRHPVPPDLAAEGEIALAAAPQPQVFDILVTKEKVEQVRQKKAVLPFLRPKVEKTVRIVRHDSRIPVGVDPKPEETGFVRRNDALALIRPGKPGSPGRNLRGAPIPGAKPEKIKVLVGDGVSLRGSEIRAEVDGFYRRGRNWVDLVPYRESQIRVYASRDRLTCLLDFRPGTGRPPSAAAVLAAALEAGFTPASLLSAANIDELLARSAAEAAPLSRHVISSSRDGVFAIEVSDDRMRATLTLCRATGNGKPLSLAEVGKEINARGFMGLDLARVRRDILAFHHGGARELPEYVLVEGVAPVAVSGAAAQWQVELLGPQRVLEIESRLGRDVRDGFPAEAVELAAFVKKGQPVARIAPPAAGRVGRDVFGAVVPAPAGATADLRLGAGLEQDGGQVRAVDDGLLEIVTVGGSTFARVRRYEEGALVVHVADSRMEAFLSLYPGEGGPLDTIMVKAAIRARGVIRGVDEALVATLVERASRGETVRDVLVATGRPPSTRSAAGSRFPAASPWSAPRAARHARRRAPQSRPGRRSRTPIPVRRRRWMAVTCSARPCPPATPRPWMYGSAPMSNAWSRATGASGSWRAEPASCALTARCSTSTTCASSTRSARRPRCDSPEACRSAGASPTGLRSLPETTCRSSAGSAAPSCPPRGRSPSRAA